MDKEFGDILERLIHSKATTRQRKECITTSQLILNGFIDFHPENGKILLNE